ncbi:hypothetical protein BHU72_00370 [Desulfuribacillus stibiiarsenatis]|uniref:Uncharacterized protein n=1 Tax=Desulfuribacillus stibiiarsenatis TaxID=1390249 RepID=A0A1E5L9Q7_9FIRM|nr:hypothetical protein [Desulfuribacillus stibiiarsenatis]OEH86764.1 hypothetical protein BHU72_00370 [Desulfuribacillus stibiiarsenatis]
MRAKAQIELDGFTIELVVQELKMGILRAEQERDFFRAQYLQVIINQLLYEKMQFHKDWERTLNNKYSKYKN